MEIEITSEIVQEICGYIRAGATLESAALASGYKPDAIQKIIAHIEHESNGIWREFMEDIKKAQAQFEVMQLMKINAEGGAKGAQWLLERTLPKKWGSQANKKSAESETGGWDPINAVQIDWAAEKNKKDA